MREVVIRLVEVVDTSAARLDRILGLSWNVIVGNDSCFQGMEMYGEFVNTYSSYNELPGVFFWNEGFVT